MVLIAWPEGETPIEVDTIKKERIFNWVLFSVYLIGSCVGYGVISS